MNFKKFISGVSALTIAASAFAGMAVTANAATLYSQDYESGTVDWTTGTGGRFTPTILEENSNKYLSVNQDERNNNGTTISSTAVSIAAGTDYTLSFDFKIGSSTNQTPAAFNIYDASNSGKVLSFTADGTWTDKWIINDGDKVQLSKSGGGKAIADLGWYTATLTRSGGKEYLTITDKAEGTAVLDKKSVSGSATGGIGKFEFVTRRYNANFAIDNVFVRDVETDDLPSTPQGEFSVVYKTEAGTTLTKTSSGSGDVDSAPTLSTADKAAFVENGQKYIYVSDNAANVTIASDNSAVVTVTVRAAETYNYTVKSSLNTTIATGSVLEGDSATVAYSQYLLSDGDLYQANAHDDNSKQYKWTFTPNTDNYELTIPYQNTTITDVVFYSEGEDVTTLNPINANHIDIRASKAYAGSASEDAVITTLPAGYYKIYGRTACTANGSADVTVKLGENTIASYNHGKSANTYDFNSGDEAVLITSPTALTFASSNTTDVGLDYIYVVKTGDYEAPATTEDAFTFTQPLSALQDLMMYVTRSSDGSTAAPVAVSGLGTLDGTTLYTGEGDAQLAIIFENIPESWGTLSVVLK